MVGLHKVIDGVSSNNVSIECHFQVFKYSYDPDLCMSLMEQSQSLMNGNGISRDYYQNDYGEEVYVMIENRKWHHYPVVFRKKLVFEFNLSYASRKG